MKYFMSAVTVCAALMAGEAGAQDAPSVPAVIALSAPLPGVQSPHDWNVPYIVLADQKITLTTGRLVAGQPLVTFPFNYSRPLRLKNNVRTLLHTLPAGSYGFDVGDFGMPLGDEHVECFFRADAPQPYAVPECLRQVGFMGIGWASANNISNNIPLGISPGSPVAGEPEVETGVTIDHAFSFQLVIRKWTKKSLHVAWLTEGYAFAKDEWPLTPEGTVVVNVPEGTITLTRDASDKDITVVSFAPGT